MATKPKKPESIIDSAIKKLSKSIADNIRRSMSANVVATKDVPATILYKKLPADMILIVGFENFLTMDDILDKYGRVVTVTYNNYPVRMVGDVGGIIVYGGNGKQSLRIGEVLKKDEFSKTIAHIKKCGSLLHDIITAVNDEEVSRIKI